MSDDQVRVARQMHDSGEYSTQAIADTLGVSRRSVYRYLSAGHKPHRCCTPSCSGAGCGSHRMSYHCLSLATIVYRFGVAYLDSV